MGKKTQVVLTCRQIGALVSAVGTRIGLLSATKTRFLMSSKGM